MQRFGKKKPSIALIILIVLLIVVGIATYFAVRFIGGEVDSDEITDELSDEFSRIRWFITDWYSELNAKSKCQVYLNELRFENGRYTLTTANDRIRAVYPRGERFFKLEKFYA